MEISASPEHVATWIGGLSILGRGVKFYNLYYDQYYSIVMSMLGLVQDCVEREMQKGMQSRCQSGTCGSLSSGPFQILVGGKWILLMIRPVLQT
jgi:hypothetical protein